MSFIIEFASAALEKVGNVALSARQTEWPEFKFYHIRFSIHTLAEMMNQSLPTSHVSNNNVDWATVIQDKGRH